MNQIVTKDCIPNCIVDKVLDKYNVVIYTPDMHDWTPDEIESFRKTNSLTRRKLGELLGVSNICIYQWERGVRKPSKTVKILLTRIEEDFRKGVK